MMNKAIGGLLALAFLGGCSVAEMRENVAGAGQRISELNPLKRDSAATDVPAPAAASGAPMETAASGLITPGPSAQTAATLDTATPAEKAAATQTASKGTLLGVQTLSLGDPQAEGIWVKTSLVESRQPGTIKLKDGPNVLVDLIPLEGSGPAQISLSALRLLGLQLSSLPVVEVYTR